MSVDTIASFTKAILSGDQHESWHIIQRAVNEPKMTQTIFHHIITPSMIEIGRLWQENEITVADEHLATTTCDFILARYKYEVLLPRIKGVSKTKGKALFFCVEHEQHDLGIRMTAQVFEEEGFDVRMMGANLPLEYVTNMASTWDPDVIGVSASMFEQGKKIPSYVKELVEQLVTAELLIGGRHLSLSTEEKLEPISDRVTLVRAPEDLTSWMNERSRKREEKQLEQH